MERGGAGINQSIGPLEDVVAKDPSFAPAYADLAAAYVYRSGVFQFDISKEMSKMRAAADKAIQLDPLLSQAHYAQQVEMAARDREMLCLALPRGGRGRFPNGEQELFRVL